MITSITSLIWILLGAACWDDFDRWHFRRFGNNPTASVRDLNYLFIMLLGPLVFMLVLLNNPEPHK